ncbi:hypothetical protein SAMN05216411_11741 [Nitrosospira multiformis]|nr:hypothetical protein SAMN05216411_11741 [Nitrosospira multiformis]
MIVVSRLLLLSLLGILASCVTVREYPRCYLFRAPNTMDIEVVNRDTKKLLEEALRVENFSIGKDVIVVNALAERHRNLAAVWPSNGCVNLRHPSPETGEMNDKFIVSMCQDFLDELIKRKESSPQVSRAIIAKKYPNFTCH